MSYIDYQDNGKFTTKKGDDIVNSSSPDMAKNAGILIPDDVVVIDIDCLGLKNSKELVKLLDYETQTVFTDRGVHLYFKYNKYEHVAQPEKMCMLGFPVEYKIKKHDMSTITVKKDGVERTMLHKHIYMDLPVEFQQRKYEYVDLRGLIDGESRYNSILKQLSTLIHRRDAVLTTISQVVLEEPLSNKNLLALVNAGRKEGIIPNKKMLEQNPNLDVEYVIEELTPVKYEGVVYYRLNDKWIHDEDLLTRYIYDKFNFLNSYRINEIFKQVSMRCEMVNDNDFQINVKGGFLLKGSHQPFELPNFTPYTIDRVYNTECKEPKEYRQFMDFITDGDKDFEEYLYQVYASSLIPSVLFRKSVSRLHIIYGDGGNGKGIIGEIISNTLGKENVSSLKIEQFDDKDNLLTLKGKLVCMGEDIEDAPIKPAVMAKVKNITAGEWITDRAVYGKKSNEYYFTTNLVFSSNHKIKSIEKGESVERRIYYIPFLNSISYDMKHNADTIFTNSFFDKLRSEETYNYVFKRLVDSYIQLYKNWGIYQESQKVLDFTREYHKENNNVIMYVDDINKIIEDMSTDEIKTYLTSEFIGKTKKEVHEEYSIWCEQDGVNPLSLTKFTDKICLSFGLKVAPRKVSGKSIRVLVFDKESGYPWCL